MVSYSKSNNTKFAKVKYLYFDSDGNLKIKQNINRFIECMPFSVYGNDTVEDLKDKIYSIAHKFGVKKIVYRTRPLSYKDTPNFIIGGGVSACCVCYLIVDGDVNV